MNIKEYAERLSQKTGETVKPGKIVDALRVKSPGLNWTVNSEVPQEMVAALGNLQEQGEQFHSAGSVNESAIVNADQAIQEASFKLVEADKATIAQAISVQDGQSEVLGEASGIKGGLKFMQSHIRGKQLVLDSFAEEAMTEIHRQLEAIDQGLIELATEASGVLGKSISKQQQTSQMMKNLRQRVVSMKGKLNHQ